MYRRVSVRGLLDTRKDDMRGIEEMLVAAGVRLLHRGFSDPRDVV